MKRFTQFALTAVAGICLLAAAPRSQAQVSVGVQIGSEPACPYGYFDYAPYNCAPYGYYGPEWFTNGVFVGAGPWYHGHEEHFTGHVDHQFDPRSGYHGKLPERGAHADWQSHHGTVENFRGKDTREEHANTNNGHEEHH